MSVPALLGAKVTLRPMTLDDLPLLMKWGSDPAFRRYQWGQKPGKFEGGSARAWIERMSRPGDSACWIIEHERRPIGFANYRDFHPKGRSAEIGIGIGEPDLWGKHLGRDALEALLRYLFDELGLHRVGLSVVGFNDRAISMYKAVGFEVEGIERDGVGTEDGYIDDVKMGIVKGRPRPDFDPRPVTLGGDFVRLAPLRMEHAQTLYGKGARRTPVNTESKLLLLGHAFDTLGANRVWLQTDKRNERSQNAIARLGAIREGELRNERILADGHLRTSVIFAITKEDWPKVRERLLGFLAR